MLSPLHINIIVKKTLIFSSRKHEYKRKENINKNEHNLWCNINWSFPREHIKHVCKKNMYDLCHTFTIEKQLERNKINCVDQSYREHKER